MELISVVVITYNEEKHIARCLASVRAVADEIVVLDSLSTDNTVSIAMDYGAVIYQQPFAGYVAQKNAAIKLARNNYVLCLDADEALSPELTEALIEIKKAGGTRPYKMNRRAFYCGAFIRHGTWYPEPKLRLFDRRFLSWGGLDPHDRVTAPQNMKVAKLNGDILHFICDSLEEHKLRSENFATIAAQSLYGQGKKANRAKIIASPLWFFISDYVLRAGFLSGWRGWKIATIQARYHYLKYLRLWKLRRGNF